MPLPPKVWVYGTTRLPHGGQTNTTPPQPRLRDVREGVPDGGRLIEVHANVNVHPADDLERQGEWYDLATAARRLFEMDPTIDVVDITLWSRGVPAYQARMTRETASGSEQVEAASLPQRPCSIGLFGLPPETTSTTLTFDDLESLVGPLPRAARKRQWWTNRALTGQGRTTSQCSPARDITSERTVTTRSASSSSAQADVRLGSEPPGLRPPAPARCGFRSP